MANVKQFKQKTTGTLLDIEDTQARSDIASEVTNRTNADNALQEKININKNDISELKGDLDKIYDASLIYPKLKDGYYANSGNKVNFYDSPSFVSAVIDVNVGDKYLISLSETGASQMPYYRLCDNELNLIKSSEYSTTDTTINDLLVNIPKNATKLVLTASKTFGLKTIIVKKLYPRIEKTELLISDNLTPMDLNISIESGYYFDDNGIVGEGESPAWVRSIIDVKEHDILSVSLSITGESCMPCYLMCDNQLNIINKGEIKEVDFNYTDYDVIIPSGVTKLVLSASTEIGSKTIVVKKNVLKGTKALSLIESKPLSNLKYIAFGDSITTDSQLWTTWRTTFREMTGANELACYAVGGAHLCDYSDTVLDGNPTGSTSSNTICNQVHQMLLNPPTEIPDFIIISAGTNDNVTPIETLENRNLPNFQNDVGEYRSGKQFIDIDSVDRTAWDGAMRWQAEKLWSIYPTTKIIYVAPIQSADIWTRPTWSILSKGKLMEYISNNMGCITIQAGAESGIYSRYEVNGGEGKYLIDGLHPNAEGGKLLGKYIANKLMNIFSV